MEQLLEILQQIADLVGVAIDGVTQAAGGASGGAPGEGAPAGAPPAPAQ